MNNQQLFMIAAVATIVAVALAPIVSMIGLPRVDVV